MITAVHHADVTRYTAAKAPRTGLLRRAFEAIVRSRRWHADQAIGQFIAHRGGRLTDENERVLMERLMWSGFGEPRLR